MARFLSDSSGSRALNPSCTLFSVFSCVCRTIRWCFSAPHRSLKSKSSCVCRVKGSGIDCVSLKPPQMHRYKKGLNLYLFIFKSVCGVLRLSRVSECPSRPRYLLLHFGAVSVCASLTGDAVQLLNGRSETLFSSLQFCCVQLYCNSV